jgi:hypothetical protein
MRNLTPRILGIIFLVLTLIGQPTALACSSCGSLNSNETTSTSDPVMSSPHAHHNIAMMNMDTGSDIDTIDTIDTTGAESHDCCKDKKCSGSHCVSPSAFFSTEVILSFAPMSDHPSDTYREAYIGTFADSPYKPPILG